MKKIKREEKDKVESQEEAPKGREISYFFPNKMISVKASSQEEALKKLRRIIKNE